MKVTVWVADGYYWKPTEFDTHQAALEAVMDGIGGEYKVRVTTEVELRLALPMSMPGLGGAGGVFYSFEKPGDRAALDTFLVELAGHVVDDDNIMPAARASARKLLSALVGRP